MNSIAQDIRFALRQLRRSPAFAITVVATLALGIGLNAAIFSVVDGVLLRPLGYTDANRIMALQTYFIDENRSIPRLGGDDYRDLSRQVHGLESTAYYQSFDKAKGVDGSSAFLTVSYVSPRFDEVMGVQPIAGRLFSPADNQEGDNLLATVSAAFACEHFGSAQAAVGQLLQGFSSPSVIVGVIPDGFSFPGKTQVWIETDTVPYPPSRTGYNNLAVGKRRTGVSPAQLDAELATFSRQLQQAYPEDAKKRLEAVSLQDQIVGKVRPTLNLLMGSVGVILLIVCANITHIQLVRATRQMRSITIRTVLGASRRALATRALTEAALLALIGSIAALLIAEPALKLLVHLAPAELPRLADIHLNADVFLFSFLIACVVMATTSLLPVWRFWHVDPAAALRQDASRGMVSRGSVWLRDGLIVAEVALTLTLSVIAVLLTRQLMAQSRQDLGFAAQSLVTLDTHSLSTPPPQGLSMNDQAIDAWRQKDLAHLDASLNSIARVPGVISAAGIVWAPMGFGGRQVKYAVKGRQTFDAALKDLPEADFHPITPGLFATMGVPLLRGRMLNDRDRTDAPPVLLINQQMALTLFPHQDPLGKQILCHFGIPLKWSTVVGVVGDIRSESPATPPAPTFYVPIAQNPEFASDLQFIVRTALPPAAMVETLRKSLLQSHPEIAVKATTMREDIANTQRSDTFRSLLFGSFAFVSILLAAVGVYGITAYSVAQRRFEFGLRFALGAQRVEVLTMVLRNALMVTALGLFAGIILSFALLRLLASLFGKLPAFDLAAYALATLSVLAVALSATLIPARRASTIDPMTVLRSE